MYVFKIVTLCCYNFSIKFLVTETTKAEIPSIPLKTANNSTSLSEMGEYKTSNVIEAKSEESQSQPVIKPNESTVKTNPTSPKKTEIKSFTISTPSIPQRKQVILILSLFYNNSILN
jgi:hypothetical protein